MLHLEIDTKTMQQDKLSESEARLRSIKRSVIKLNDRTMGLRPLQYMSFAISQRGIATVQERNALSSRFEWI